MTNVCIQIELATAVILNEERKNFIFDVVCMEKKYYVPKMMAFYTGFAWKNK